jgi:excisionase family DNA binding protein
LTAGIGAGVGLGNVITDSLKGVSNSGSSANGAAAGVPDVMTPAEAARILQVSEEDVVAAIEDKSLKAKKIGKAYRISKSSLEEFLKG